jgi:serine/threonine protein kinase
MITCGPYICTEVLGEGSFATVMKAKHSINGDECALKILKNEFDWFLTDYNFLDEVDIHKQLHHNNIVKLAAYDESAEYTPADGVSSRVNYMALELAKYGNISDTIIDSGKLSEPIVRFYFHQLLEAVEYMHNKDIAHRDIKLENILIDESFDLKLTDFSFSGKEKTSYIAKGSSLYKSPEMYDMKQFETVPSDIFAIGICLFMMVSGHLPFANANESDYYYSKYLNKPASFWKIHFKKENKYIVSKSLIKLLNKIFTNDPNKRPSIELIKQCEWYNEPLPTKEQVVAEMVGKVTSL